MKPQALVVAACFGLFAAAPAAAQVNVPVGPFRSIELNGGGRVLVRYAPVQQVRILQGNSRISAIHVSNDASHGDRDKLIIDTCPNRCPMGYRLELVIDAPDLDALGVDGEGVIEVSAGFPRRDNFAVGVMGTGRIDARALAAKTVSAGVSGDGDISLGPSEMLTAGVKGRGRIVYRGHPKVVSGAKGGGRIEQAD